MILKKLLYKDIARVFIKFCLVGCVNTCINISIYLILLRLYVPYLISGSTGFIAGVISGFYLNRRWTFSVLKSNNRMFFLYFFVNLFSLGVNLIALFCFVNIFYFSKEIAQLYSVLFTTITNFVGVRTLVFRKKSEFKVI